MAAKKKAPAKPTRKDLERVALAALVRCGAAAAAQSKAEAAYQRWLRNAYYSPGPSAALATAQQETDRAGAALIAAVRALRCAK